MKSKQQLLEVTLLHTPPRGLTSDVPHGLPQAACRDFSKVKQTPAWPEPTQQDI